MHDSLLSQEEIDALLKGLQADGTRSAVAEAPVPTAEADKPVRLEQPDGGTAAPAAHEAEHPNLGVILDIPLRVTVSLGRAKKTVGEVLKIGPGTIVELDRLAGDPVDIYLNEKLIARGEVVVVGENFAVRIAHIVGLCERMQMLR
jgi:flagellar motor switch protein FliN/FliY